jgi:hypothetical protein
MDSIATGKSSVWRQSQPKEYRESIRNQPDDSIDRISRQ